MKEDEAYKFIDEEMKPLWPEWELSDAEIPIWIHNLKCFDFKLCRKGVRDYYTTREGSFKRPKLSGIIKATIPYQEAAHPIAKSEKVESTTDVFVQCTDHDNPLRMYTFCGIYVNVKKQDNHDYVMRAAERTRRKCERLYGGSWIIIQKTNRSKMTKKTQEYRKNGNLLSGVTCK
ncbi:hypothetical protein ACFL1G_08870 [Planctomycetota bacterium]